MTTDLMWVEKYRPKTINDCVLPARFKNYFKSVVESGNIDNVCLVGKPGTGKTTAALALCAELKLDHLLINASKEGIDAVRTMVTSFATSMSFSGGYRVVILDECDGLTAAAQGALRGAIEELSANARFILTANFENKIIEPLRSRCPVVDFTFTKQEKIEVMAGIHKRTMSILEMEGVVYDNNDLLQLIKINLPDMRSIVQKLQINSKNGQLTIDASNNISEENLRILTTCLKKKDFVTMRKWVAENQHNSGAMIRRDLYEKMSDILVPESIPQFILTLAQYDFREAQVVDKEINMVAMFIELMADARFK